MNDMDRSQSNRLAEYLSFASAHATLFANPPEGGFRILLDGDAIRRVEAKEARGLRQKDLPVEWAQVGIVYTDQYLVILRDAVRFPDGETGTYVRVVGAERVARGVVILPLYEQRVLLVRHFRHATRAWHLEIPRGFGAKQSSSEENARRELAEETGATPSRLIALGEMHTNAGITSECVALFYAEIPSFGQPDTHEAIAELLPVSLSEFERLISEGGITDSFTIAAYTRAKLRGLL